MLVNPPPAVFARRVVDHRLVPIEIKGNQYPIAKNLVLLMFQQVIHLGLCAIHRAPAVHVVPGSDDLVVAEFAAVFGEQERRKS